MQQNIIKNKKGFTLVELIIVIAIIAVLAAIAIPGYTTYLKRASVTSDETYIGELAHNMEMTAASDIKVLGQVVTLTFNSDGAYVLSSDDATALSRIQTSLDNLFPSDKRKFTSETYLAKTGESGVKLTLKSTGGVKIENTEHLDRP